MRRLLPLLSYATLLVWLLYVATVVHNIDSRLRNLEAFAERAGKWVP